MKNGRDGGAPRDLGEHALVVDPRGVVVAEHRELARYLQLVGRRVQADERHVLWESRAEKGGTPSKKRRFQRQQSLTAAISHCLPRSSVNLTGGRKPRLRAPLTSEPRPARAMEPRRSQRIKISNEGGALGALLRHLPVVFESEVLRHLDVDDLFSLSRVNKECRRAASNAWNRSRGPLSKVRRHYELNKLSKDLDSIDAATVDPVLIALVTSVTGAEEFAKEAEKLRAEVANDRRQSPLSSSGEFYIFPRRAIIASRLLQDAAAAMMLRTPAWYVSPPIQ